MRSNKVEYITVAGMYFTTHDVKVPFCMPEFSSRKISNHQFHVDNDEDESGIGYDMIIGCDLMVKLGLTADFKHQVLQWDGATLHMKEPINLLVQSNLTKRKMRKVLMHTTEPASTREATERILKILDSTYSKVDLEQVVSNASQMIKKELCYLAFSGTSRTCFMVLYVTGPLSLSTYN